METRWPTQGELSDQAEVEALSKPSQKIPGSTISMTAVLTGDPGVPTSGEPEESLKWRVISVGWRRPPGEKNEHRTEVTKGTKKQRFHFYLPHRRKTGDGFTRRVISLFRKYVPSGKIRGHFPPFSCTNATQSRYPPPMSATTAPRGPRDGEEKRCSQG
jgi:hypothetical protein